ncbi:DUF1178 family protein [Lichenicoccus sp.]|uniref:DUF1178 family protein n=1 Tax=Lichenicoccus sp. TaxID=2781899 RepID=UPI003D0F007F
MIHYLLRCNRDHGFEGWFRDSAAFDEQSDRGLLSCPQCGSGSVQRAVMAPAVRSGRPPVASGTNDSPSAEVMVPDQLRAALQRMRAEIERQCDDVGEGFAEAARRLHRAQRQGETMQRGIYGQASPAQRETLAEEGIETMQVPWLPRADG